MLHAICLQVWKTQQWPQDWKKSIFIPIPKKGSTKESSNHWTIALISHASKVMLKILHSRLQHELRNSRYTGWVYKMQRNQRSNCQHSLDHRQRREFQKNIYICLIDYAKVFDCMDHNKLWEILKEMGIPDHSTYLWETSRLIKKQQLEPCMELTGSGLTKE